MGNRMTEKDIQQQLFKMFRANKGYKYQLCNAYVFRWESDFFCIASSGFSYEIEIKCTRSDFFADFRKKRKHEILNLPFNQDWRVKKGSVYGYDRYGKRLPYITPRCGVSFTDLRKSRPNKFCYAVPDGLVERTEVPKYAGLMYISEDTRRLPLYIKRPPALHKNKNDFTSVLLDKYYWAYLNSQNQLEAGKTFEFPQQQMRRTR